METTSELIIDLQLMESVSLYLMQGIYHARTSELIDIINEFHLLHSNISALRDINVYNPQLSQILEQIQNFYVQQGLHIRRFVHEHKDKFSAADKKKILDVLNNHFPLSKRKTADILAKVDAYADPFVAALCECSNGLKTRSKFYNRQNTNQN
jgi:hypothetical protein